MTADLTRAEAAFARCAAVLGHHFTLSDVARNRLNADYEVARRAGFYQSAGIENTPKAADWANSQRGAAAIADALAQVR